ncbi:MAG: ferritin [Deltaproteobacteria bacterium]|nr:ferritin [Deltaproteobacteria bacterium]MBI4224618.1 ferritin [Deltaproteobacteria bacterium]
MSAFKMEKALNDHIAEEIYSGYLYLAMAAFCYEKGLNGFAHWMKLQSKEEWGHAMKIYDFIVQRGGRVQLKEIKKPPADFGSAHPMMKQVLAHEQKVSAALNKLYEEAGRLKDNATQVMLQWFVGEQVEEEAQVNDILVQLQFISDKSSAIFFIDRHLGKREG